MDAMNVQNAIKKAISTAGACGYAAPEEVAKSVESLENPTYRVAVVGKFKVGKSTLINHAFLGDNPILSEGARFTAQTAVATEVESGDVSRLERYDWAETGGEKLVLTKDDPTCEDVIAETVGNSESQRTELARKVSRVKLTTPNESLKGYAVIDTPGLDDPNKELLLNTTFRVIPGSDVALLIVEPKMLDQVEDDLLRKTLIDNGVSRLMVLVSYKPEESDCRSKQKRIDVVETIKAQLAKIGRADIPVEMYCFDPAVEDITNNATDLRIDIRTFLNENALPGRLEHVAFVVRQYLADLELEIAAKIKALGSSEAEKTALKTKVETQIADFKSQCERAFRRLQNEMEILKSDASQDVDRRVHKVFSNFKEKIEHASDISEIRSYFDNAENGGLKNDIMVEVNAIGMTLKSEVNRIVDRYNDESVEGMSSWNAFLCDELGVERPFLAKVPPLVWDAIFVAVWNYFLPFGWLTAILGHVIGKKTFGLDPDAVLKPIILAQARSKISEAEGQIRVQINDQVKANVEAAFLKIKEGLETYNQTQVEKMRKMVENDEVSSERGGLEKAKADIAAAIESLN